MIHHLICALKGVLLSKKQEGLEEIEKENPKLINLKINPLLEIYLPLKIQPLMSLIIKKIKLHWEAKDKILF